MKSTYCQIKVVRFFNPGIKVTGLNRREFVSQLRRILAFLESPVKTYTICTRIPCVPVLYSSYNNRGRAHAFRPNITQVINHHSYSILRRNQDISWRILNYIRNNTDDEEVHQEKVSEAIKQPLFAGRGTSQMCFWMDMQPVLFI